MCDSCLIFVVIKWAFAAENKMFFFHTVKLASKI